METNAERILLTKIVIASGGDYTEVEEEISKVVNDPAHQIVLEAMEEYAQVKVSELKTILFNCRTQIEFMNDEYCNGQSDSAIAAIKAIDKNLSNETDN